MRNDYSAMTKQSLGLIGANAQKLVAQEDAAVQMRAAIENLPNTFREMGNVPDAIKMGAESMQQILGAGMEPTNKPASTIAPAPPKARVKQGTEYTFH